jgi:membrane-associated phospholipid phosphatase
MTAWDYGIQLTLSVFLIVGVYQFYFWCQRNPLAEPRQLRLPLDDLIPYRPNWVWIYSFLYYPVILYTNLVIASPREFTHLAMSYLLLLGLQMAVFVSFPVVTPEEWRPRRVPRSRAERFLSFVQRLDARSNSFPSMHTSVATLTALHLHPSLGAWAWAFPVLIGLSCLFTKQHYVVDLPAGAGLGALAYWIYSLAA